MNVSLVENTTAATQLAEFERLKQGVRMMNRRDLCVAFEWIFTLPKELHQSSQAEQRVFFETVKSALESRYQQPALSAWCHTDEAANPHIHLIFTAIKDDNKRGGKKFCCKEIINLPEYSKVYDSVQDALDAAGIQANVKTGVTKKQGGNHNYHIERQQEREREQSRERPQEHTEHEQSSRKIKLNRKEGKDYEIIR